MVLTQAIVLQHCHVNMMHNRLKLIRKKGLLTATVPNSVWPLILKEFSCSLLSIAAEAWRYDRPCAPWLKAEAIWAKSDAEQAALFRSQEPSRLPAQIAIPDGITVVVYTY